MRDHQRLVKIEERGLASEGVSPHEAHERALQMASAIIQDAKLQAAAIAASGGSDTKAAVEAKRERQKAMLAEARSGKYASKRDPLAGVKFALGGQTRLLAGCILLGIFAVRVGWVDMFRESAQSGNVENVDPHQFAWQTIPDQLKSMSIAGVLLLFSAFVSGWRMTPFAIVATIVILFGPSFPIPGFGDTIEPWMVAAVIGIVVYIPGVLFGESKDLQ